MIPEMVFWQLVGIVVLGVAIGSTINDLIYKWFIQED